MVESPQFVAPVTDDAFRAEIAAVHREEPSLTPDLQGQNVPPGQQPGRIARCQEASGKPGESRPDTEQACRGGRSAGAGGPGPDDLQCFIEFQNPLPDLARRHDEARQIPLFREAHDQGFFVAGDVLGTDQMDLQPPLKEETAGVVEKRFEVGCRQCRGVRAGISRGRGHAGEERRRRFPGFAVLVIVRVIIISGCGRHGIGSAGRRGVRGGVAVETGIGAVEVPPGEGLRGVDDGEPPAGGTEFGGGGVGRGNGPGQIIPELGHQH